MKLTVVGCALGALSLFACADVSAPPDEADGEGPLGAGGDADHATPDDKHDDGAPQCSEGFARVDLASGGVLQGARALVEIGGSLRIVATTGLSGAYDGTGALLANTSYDLGAGLTSVVSVEGLGFTSTGPHGCSVAKLIFSTEGGRLLAVNPDLGSRDGFVVVDRSSVGADYKGVAVLQTQDGPLLLAADFYNGRLDVFDTNYELVDLGPDAFVPFGFADSNLGLTNVAVLDGFVYITYATKDATGHQPADILGGGLVVRFTPGGEVVGQMGCTCFSRPFGLAMAPAGYLASEKRLLVANKGYDGIVGVDPNLMDGSFLDFVERPDGQLLEIEGVTGISFGAGVDAERLFFTASPDDGSASSFGSIEATCE